MEWTRRSAWFGRVVVVAAALMTATGLVLVERLSRTYEDGLAVTQSSAVLISDAVDPLARLSTDLAALGDELAAGIEVGREVVVAATGTLEQVGDAAATNLAEIATGAAGISEDLADLVQAIERLIPGESESLAEDLRRLADGLEPVGEQLVVLGEQLTSAATELGDTDATLVALARRIEVLVADVEALGPTFDALAVTADDLGARAEAATTRLGLDRWLLRLLVVVGGVVVASLGLVVERFAVRLGRIEARSTDAT